MELIYNEMSHKPSMLSTIADYCIWIAPVGCSLALSVLVWRQRSQTYLKIFILFLFFESIDYSVNTLFQQLYISHLLPAPLYTWFYFAFLFLGYALQTGVLYQLFYALLKPHKVLPDRAFAVFIAGCLTILGVSVIVAYLQPGTFAVRLLAISVDIMLSYNLLACAACFFVVAFATALGLPKRHYIVGVALGMGLMNLGDLVALAITTKFGVPAYKVIRLFPQLVYLCSTLIWIDYFRITERERTTFDPRMLSALEKIKRFIDSRFVFALTKPKS